jgi:hypothetical protein
MRLVLRFHSHRWCGAEPQQTSNGAAHVDIQCSNVSSAGSFDALRHFCRETFRPPRQIDAAGVDISGPHFAVESPRSISYLGTAQLKLKAV